MKPTEQAITQYFHDHSDCFADAEGNDLPIPAMTVSKVIETAQWAISQMQPEWVRVEDRLPEIGLGGVQILLEDSHSKERFQMTANYDGEWIFPADPAERVKVIYWHYLLPEPVFTECEMHGHSLQPVVGFDNEITDYQCLGCGIFESQIHQPPTK